MEKGSIKTISSSNAGVIIDDKRQNVNYISGSFVGKNMSRLKVGDLVWFERVGHGAQLRAINIRRC